MKLNKKLLTAALAGALIVQAVPATTFAQEPAGQQAGDKVGLERILERLAKFNAEYKELTEKKATLVSQIYRPKKDTESVEQYEAALKGELEKAQEKTDADAKDVEAKKKALAEAHKAYLKAIDDKHAADKKAEAAEAALHAKEGNREDEIAAAKAANKKAYDDAAAAKAEVLRTKDDAIKAAKAEFAEKEREEKTAKENLDKGKVAKPNDTVYINELEKKYEDAQTAKKAAEAKQAKAEKAAANLEAEAAKTEAAAKAAADEKLEEELDRIERKYNVNFDMGKDAAELHRLALEMTAAKKAATEAEENETKALEAFTAANTALEAAEKTLAESSAASYKKASELKEIEVKLSKVILSIEKLLGNEKVNIKSIAGKVSEDLYKNLELASKMTDSEKLALIAKQNKEYNELLAKYNKLKDSATDVKPLVTYKFTVKDTAGKGVEGLTLQLTKVNDPSVVRVATSDKDGVILIPGMVQGRYSVAVKKIPTGYEVYQGGKKVSEVQALFKAASEVKAENNAEAVTGAKKDEKKETKSKIELPEIVNVGETSEDSSKPAGGKKDEKVVDGGTIVVQKKKKEDKKEVKKPVKPAKKVKKAKKKLPKAGVAAEAATIAAAAMATMGGAFLSLKKRK